MFLRVSPLPIIFGTNCGRSPGLYLFPPPPPYCAVFNCCICSVSFPETLCYGAAVDIWYMNVPLSVMGLTNQQEESRLGLARNGRGIPVKGSPLSSGLGRTEYRLGYNDILH